MDTADLGNEELILSFLAEGGDAWVSGSALSDKLGLSRTAIWKHVETLRRLGYRIDAQPARGYRLAEVPDRVTSLEVSPFLSTREVGRTIHHHDSVGSTNAEASELAREGAFHGEVVVAEQQTDGRGRRGRSWSSPPGKNLYASVILRPDVPPQRAPELTLLAAVALAQTIRDMGLDARIKWPNDVQVGGRKVAGILTELSADTERIHAAVLGLGVNLNAGEEDFPPELRSTAVSLRQAGGRPVHRALFAAALFGQLEAWLDCWTAQGFEPVRAAWRGLSSTLGQSVAVHGERSVVQGVAEDIDETGALLIRQGTERVRVMAGDVEHLRPAPTA